MGSDDFNGRSRSFLDWFTSSPGTTFHPDIKLADLRYRGAGRGITDIEPDTVLFTIPRSLIICPETSGLVSKLPGLFAVGEAGEGSSQDRWSSLILVMIYEYLRGADSVWKPYMDVLPATFDTPMFWSEEELKDLRPTAIASRIGRAEADEMIASKIIPVVRGHEDVFFLDEGSRQEVTDSRLAELAHRMGSTIMAYAFDLESDDDDGEEDDGGGGSDGEGDGEGDGWVEDREEKVLGMVPMADILNADTDFNAHINHEERALVATSLRPIRAGEEVLNYYGPLSNGELLLRYGYVTAKSRRWDVVDLPWSSVIAGLKERLGVSDEAFAKAEKRLDPLETEDVFYIEWGSDPPDSTGHVQDTVEFHGLPVELQQQARQMIKAIRDVDTQAAGQLRSSEMREAVFLEATRHALDMRLASYGGFLEQDTGVAEGSEYPQPAGRAEAARAVRLGETKLLREALAGIRDRLAEVERKASSAVPESKRRKIA